jgi:hypothetical protein
MKTHSLIVFLVLGLIGVSGVHVNAQQVTPSVAVPPPAAPVTQWPQRLDSPDGLITVYEPQPNKFEGDVLTARAAVSLTPTGATDPEFGAMWFTARVSTDRDARIVTVQNVTIKQVKLPNSAGEQETKFGQVIEQQVPGMNLMLSLDQLEATVGVIQKEKQETQQLDNSPPNIVFVNTPTTLVVLDGQPKLQATQDNGVMAVINTPFVLLFDGNSKRYFLKAGEFWMVAPDVTGPYAPAGNDVPAGVTDAGSKLTDNSSAQANGQPNGQAAQQQGPGQIMVAEQPTELIASQGPPTYTPLPGNNLLYMSNTQSDVFIEVASQQFYVLLSGRWFSSKSLQGPWAFVAADKLPGAFAQIPADSPKANVLVSVAGTQQAKDARMDAFIPQTTAIDRNAGANLAVSYDGDPQFAAIDNSPVTYASNCADPVLDVNNTYYCCHQAVWYQSAAALGPWAVCTAVPQVIYTLPPSCPVYNCRYVYVYDSTPDTVYCGYLPGYTGCYVYNGTVVYGTGYNYPYWYHSRFIPRPYTWGFGAAYDFYAGTWGFGATYNYSSAWFANRPERHEWFGPQGYLDYRENHGRVEHLSGDHAESRNATINRFNIYNRQENVKRNIEVRNSVHVSNESRPIPGHKEYPAAENNVYVGQDGAVFRRSQTGWETRDAKGWTAIKSLPDERVQAAPGTHAEHAGQDEGRIAGHAEQHIGQQPEQHAAQNADQHVGQFHEAGENITPHEINAHETPVQRAPETPIHQEPSRGDSPQRAEEPGLEQERAARERPSFGASDQHSAPAESHAGGGEANVHNGGGNIGGQRGAGGRGH